jgi:L-alanine-DL-glutamate epimerase-like enolase superfamily enzyme
MRIRTLTCYSVDIPAKPGGYVMSHGRLLHSFPTTIVKLTAEDGTVGYGEACTLGGNYLDGHPGSVRETVRALAPAVLGADPWETGVIVDRMDSMITNHLPGKAAIDMAVWDLLGRLTGTPVAKLLGGIQQKELAAFQAISLGEPDEMANEALKWRDLGFRKWQLKLGDDPSTDVERARAVAEALGPDSSFMTCDANAGWTAGQAMRFVNGIRDLNAFVEQPARSLAECAQVAAVSTLPILLDEIIKTQADLVDALKVGCVQAINLKPVRVGGLTKAARIRDLAEAAGVMLLIDEPQGADLASAGMAQLAATVSPKNLLAVSCFMADHMPMSYQSSSTRTGAQLVDGVVVLDDEPGLGVSIDERLFGSADFVISLEDL